MYQIWYKRRMWVNTTASTSKILFYRMHLVHIFQAQTLSRATTIINARNNHPGNLATRSLRHSDFSQLGETRIRERRQKKGLASACSSLEPPEEGARGPRWNLEGWRLEAYRRPITPIPIRGIVNSRK